MKGPVTEGPILSESTHEIPRVITFTETESRVMGLGGGGGWAMSASWGQSQFGTMKFWRGVLVTVA